MLGNTSVHQQSLSPLKEHCLSLLVLPLPTFISKLKKCSAVTNWTNYNLKGSDKNPRWTLRPGCQNWDPHTWFSSCFVFVSTFWFERLFRSILRFCCFWRWNKIVEENKPALKLNFALETKCAGHYFVSGSQGKSHRALVDILVILVALWSHHYRLYEKR